MVYLLLVICMMLYSANLVAFRLVAPLMPPAVLACLRCLFTFLVLRSLLHRVSPPRHEPFRVTDARDFLILGLTGMVTVTLGMFVGMRYTTASNAGILYASSPGIVAIGSVAILGETLTPLNVSGVVLSLFGAIVIITKGSLETLLGLRFNPGDVIIFVTVLGWSAYLVYGRIVLRRFDPWRVTCFSAGVGSVILGILAAFAEPIDALRSASWSTWGLILYLGFLGLGATFIISTYALQRLGAARTSIFLNLIPIFAMFFGWLLLGERIGITQIAGTVLVIVGVVLVTRPASERI